MGRRSNGALRGGGNIQKPTSSSSHSGSFATPAGQLLSRLRGAKMCGWRSRTRPSIVEGVMIVRQNKERQAFLEQLLMRANRTGYPPKCSERVGGGAAASVGATLLSPAASGEAGIGSSGFPAAMTICGLDPVVSELPMEFTTVPRPDYHLAINKELKELSMMHGQVSVIPLGQNPRRVLELCCGYDAEGGGASTLPPSQGEGHGDDVPGPLLSASPTSSRVLLSIQQLVRASHDTTTTTRTQNKEYDDDDDNDDGSSGRTFSWCSHFGLVVVTLKPSAPAAAAAAAGAGVTTVDPACDCGLLQQHLSTTATAVGFVAAIVKLSSI